MFETLSSGIVDAFPEKLAKKKMLVTAMVACGMFLIGLPFTTRVSMPLIFSPCDQRSAGHGVVSVMLACVRPSVMFSFKHLLL